MMVVRLKGPEAERAQLPTARHYSTPGRNWQDDKGGRRTA